METQEPVWKSLVCEVEVPIKKKNYAVDGIISYEYNQTTLVDLVHKSSGETLIGEDPNEKKGRVLVEIKTEIQSWADTLRQIKRYQTELEIPKAILVCDWTVGSLWMAEKVMTMRPK